MSFYSSRTKSTQLWTTCKFAMFQIARVTGHTCFRDHRMINVEMLNGAISILGSLCLHENLYLNKMEVHIDLEFIWWRHNHMGSSSVCWVSFCVHVVYYEKGIIIFTWRFIFEQYESTYRSRVHLVQISLDCGMPFCVPWCYKVNRSRVHLVQISLDCEMPFCVPWCYKVNRSRVHLVQISLDCGMPFCVPWCYKVKWLSTFFSFF